MTDMMISTPQRDVAKAVRMPVIYEQAVQALIACRTLDEALYFADKAEALQAWAKIQKNDQAGLEAKRLRLHAYRRAGPLRLLQTILPDSPARAARHLARLPQREFDAVMALPHPPTPMAARNALFASSSAWNNLRIHISGLRTMLRSNDLATLGGGLAAPEAKWARAAVVEIIEGLDQFERHLPKENHD